MLIRFSLCAAILQSFLAQTTLDSPEILKQSEVIFQKQKVYLGEEIQILTLNDYGTVIDHQLIYSKKLNENWPCLPLKQSVRFQQPQYVDMIQEYTQEQFQEQFINGKYQGQIPQIIAFEQIQDGATVLTSDGKLHIISIQKLSSTLNVKIEHTEDLKDISPYHIFKNYNRALLIYEQTSNELLVILTNLHLVIKIENFKVVNNITKLESLIAVDKIEGLVRISNYVCVATGIKGLQCYRFDSQNGFHLNNISVNVNITANDIRAIKIDEDSSELYILDPNQGILVYFAQVGQNGLIVEMTTIGLIGTKNGVTFDVYRNTLMLVTKTDSVYYLHDYHIDQTDFSWVELNRWIFQSEIKDIDVSDQFAIVTGRSGHHIVYHSIYRDFYSDVFNFVIDHKSESDLYLPNLQRIDFLAKDLNSQNLNQEDVHQPIAFGITKHKFFAIEWEFNPIQIVCYGENVSLITESPIHMKYKINSTQCPTKKDKEDDMQMCQSEFEIEVTFKNSLINKEWINIILIIVGSYLGIFVLTLICLAYKFLVFKNRKNAIQNDIDNFSTQGTKVDNQSFSRDSFNEKPQYMRADLDSSKTPYSENNRFE